VTLPDPSPFPRQGIWKCPSHRRPRQTIKSASRTILGGAGLVLHRHLNVDGEIAGEASANPDFTPLDAGRVISQVLTEREMGLEMHETSPGACFLALSQSFSKYSVLGWVVTSLDRLQSAVSRPLDGAYRAQPTG
jgi:hypothetical protein